MMERISGTGDVQSKEEQMVKRLGLSERGDLLYDVKWIRSVMIAMTLMKCNLS